MQKTIRGVAFILICLLCVTAHSALAQTPEGQAGPGKWIKYGKETVNANLHGTITLLNPIAEADEAKVAAMIKDANGPIPLTIGIKFTQPAAMFYTVNTRVNDPKLAVEASKKANKMYKAIQDFLKSKETHLDLGE